MEAIAFAWVAICIVAAVISGAAIGWHARASKPAPEPDALQTALRMSLRGWETDRQMWATILDDVAHRGRHVR